MGDKNRAESSTLHGMRQGQEPCYFTGDDREYPDWYPSYAGNGMQQQQEGEKISVTAYSGYRANERPLSFVLGDQRREVKNLIDRWFGQEHDYFKVLADDDRVYLIKWHRDLDVWFLVKSIERMGKH
jgi:hypothetical protein